MKRSHRNIVKLTILAVALVWSWLSQPKAHAAGIDELPPEIAAAYKGLDKDQPVGPSAYRNFRAKRPPPWRIGYSSNYTGNSWRSTAMLRLVQDLLVKYQKANLVSSVIVTQSSLEDARQEQQIRQLVDQGVDAVIVCCANPTALNGAVEYAHSRGVVVVSWAGYLTSPYALNTSANYADGGYQIARALIQDAGGKGNFLLVSGIAGHATSESFDAGVTRALAEFPKARLVGKVMGMWSDHVAENAVARFLTNNPVQLDGIIAQSAQETGVLKGVLKSGHKKPMPISLAGSAGAACYLKRNPGWVSSGFHIWPPGDEMEMALITAIRTLQGQGPKVQSIIRPVVKMSAAVYADSVPDDCSIDSDVFLQPGITAWFNDGRADHYFLKPANPFAAKFEVKK